mgnify:CR=1 FL=1
MHRDDSSKIFAYIMLSSVGLGGSCWTAAATIAYVCIGYPSCAPSARLSFYRPIMETLAIVLVGKAGGCPEVSVKSSCADLVIGIKLSEAVLRNHEPNFHGKI